MKAVINKGTGVFKNKFKKWRRSRRNNKKTSTRRIKYGRYRSNKKTMAKRYKKYKTLKPKGNTLS
jgi:hypothetical protein